MNLLNSDRFVQINFIFYATNEPFHGVFLLRICFHYSVGILMMFSFQIGLGFHVKQENFSIYQSFEKRKSRKRFSINTLRRI